MKRKRRSTVVVGPVQRTIADLEGAVKRARERIETKDGELHSIYSRLQDFYEEDPPDEYWETLYEERAEHEAEQARIQQMPELVRLEYHVERLTKELNEERSRLAGLEQRLGDAQLVKRLPELASAGFADRQEATKTLRVRTAYFASSIMGALIAIGVSGAVPEGARDAAIHAFAWSAAALASAALNQVANVVLNGLVEFAQRVSSRYAEASQEAAWWARMAARTRMLLRASPMALVVVELVFTALASWNLAILIAGLYPK